MDKAKDIREMSVLELKRYIVGLEVEDGEPELEGGGLNENSDS